MVIYCIYPKYGLFLYANIAQFIVHIVILLNKLRDLVLISALLT